MAFVKIDFGTPEGETRFGKSTSPTVGLSLRRLHAELSSCEEMLPPSDSLVDADTAEAEVAANAPAASSRVLIWSTGTPCRPTVACGSILSAAPACWGAGVDDNDGDTT